MTVSAALHVCTYIIQVYTYLQRYHLLLAHQSYRLIWLVRRTSDAALSCSPYVRHAADRRHDIATSHDRRVPTPRTDDVMMIGRDRYNVTAERRVRLRYRLDATLETTISRWRFCYLRFEVLVVVYISWPARRQTERAKRTQQRHWLMMHGGS